MALSHVATDKIVTLKNSVITAVTNAVSDAAFDNCRDFAETTPETGYLHFARNMQFHSEIASFSETSYDNGNGNKGFAFTIFQGQKHKFPHKLGFEIRIYL